MKIFESVIRLSAIGLFWAMAASFVMADELQPLPRQFKGAQPFQQDPALDTKPQKAMDMSKQQSRVWKQQLVNNTRTGMSFLAQNKAYPGVKTLKNGVQVKAITMGEGPKPAKGDEYVEAKYVGKLIDGTVISSSPGDGSQAGKLRFAAMVPGLRSVVKSMKAGSRSVIAVPADQGYGNDGLPPAIGPGSVLVYDVEVVAVQVKEGADSSAPAAEDAAKE